MVQVQMVAMSTLVKVAVEVVHRILVLVVLVVTAAFLVVVQVEVEVVHQQVALVVRALVAKCELGASADGLVRYC